MCNKTNSDVGLNQFLFFRQDFEILKNKELGLPNCLYCGEEPNEIMWTIDICLEHAFHMHFKSCNHVVGLSASDM